MDSNSLWLKALNISDAQIERLLSDLPEGKLLAAWCIDNGYIQENEYLKWAQNFFTLPLLKSDFFLNPLSPKIASLHQSRWPEHIMPVGFWDGTLFLACLEPDYSIELPYPVQWVLAPYSEVKKWKSANAPGTAPLEPTPELNLAPEIAPELNLASIEAPPIESVPLQEPPATLPDLAELNFQSDSSVPLEESPNPPEVPHAPPAEPSHDLGPQPPPLNLDSVDFSSLGGTSEDSKEPAPSEAVTHSPEIKEESAEEKPGDLDLSSLLSDHLEKSDAQPSPAPSKSEVAPLLEAAAPEPTTTQESESPPALDFSLDLSDLSSDTPAAQVTPPVSEKAASKPLAVEAVAEPPVEPVVAAPAISIAETPAVLETPSPVVVAPPPVSANLDDDKEVELPTSIRPMGTLKAREEKVAAAAVPPPLPPLEEPVVALKTPPKTTSTPTPPAKPASKVEAPPPEPKINLKKLVENTVKAKVAKAVSGQIDLTQVAKIDSTIAVKSFDELTTYALLRMSQFFDKTMFISFENGLLTPAKWDQHWTVSKQDPVEVKQSSVFKIVHDALSPYHGYVVPNPTNEAFFNNWNQGAIPEHLTMVPIKVENSLAGILLGITDKAKGKAVRLENIEAIADEVARTMPKFKKVARAA